MIKSLAVLFLCSGIIAQTFSQELPIKIARTLKFDTREGSYMNVDLSPDGKTLAFDLLGDLYTVPATGGTASQLTRGMALNMDPIWSPDGKLLAYFSDGSGAIHLHIRDVAGTIHWVLDPGGQYLNDAIKGAYSDMGPISWTCDGRYIALHDSLYGVAGGKLARPAIISKQLVGFSANGGIKYYIDEPRFNINCGRLYAYPMNDTVKKPLTLNLNNFKAGNVSPDGRWLVYYSDTTWNKDNIDLSRRRLIAINLQTQTSRILVSSIFSQDSVFVADLPHPLHFGFSPDSKNVYIGYGGKIHKIELVTGNNTIVPFVAHVKIEMGARDYHTFRVTNDPLTVKYTRYASESPDHKHIVFSALNQLYIKDLPDGKARLLSPQPFNQFQPCWSPDSKSVAYVSWSDTIGGFLWKVKIGSESEPQKILSQATQYQHPTWSPDGKTIAVTCEKQLTAINSISLKSLEIIGLNGSVKSISDSAMSNNGAISFSSDGKGIYFAVPSGYDGGSDGAPSLENLIIYKDTSGGCRRGVAVGGAHSAPDLTFAQRNISPDGRYLVYSGAEQLYLVPISEAAQPLIMLDQSHTTRPQVIRFALGVDPHWEDGGKTLAWTYGNHFYRTNPDNIVTAAETHPQPADKNALPDEQDITTVWIRPDQTTDLDVTAPKYFAHGTIAIKNVRIITMNGGQVIEHGTLVIQNARFTNIGMANTPIPKGAKIIDGTGKTIMPGLIDTHLHMSPPDDLLPQQWDKFMLPLAFGVTTARDPSTGLSNFAYEELLETGKMLGPRLYSSGRAIILHLANRVNDQGDAESIVTERKTFGGTFMKQYVLPTRIQREWLLLASEHQGLNMTNEGDYDPRGAIGQLKDGSSGTEHHQNWEEVYKDMIILFARSGTYFTPTLQVVYGAELYGGFNNAVYWNKPDPRLAMFDPELERNVLKSKPVDTVGKGWIHTSVIDAEIAKAGGEVCLGSHGAVNGMGPHNELWGLQMGGLTSMQALREGTINGAEAIGIQKDVGSIEVGKIADLLILNSNPLDDIHNSRDIKYVMKDGVLYNSANLDEIWPVYKKCPDWKMHGTTQANTINNKQLKAPGHSGGDDDDNDDNQ